MNAFERTLAAALRDEAGEIAMSTDINAGREALDDKLDNVDRGRRRWLWGVGAVLVAVAAVVLAFVVTSRPVARPAPPVDRVTPSPSATLAFRVETSLMTPNVTADLPYWTALASNVDQGVGYDVFDQFDCGSSPCPSDKQLKIRFMTVKQMYRPQDGRTMTKNPSFSVYTDAWLSVMARGAATITDKISTTVGGRPAVAMTATFSQDVLGLAMCQQETDAPTGPLLPAEGTHLPPRDRRPGSGQTADAVLREHERGQPSTFCRHLRVRHVARHGALRLTHDPRSPDQRGGCPAPLGGGAGSRCASCRRVRSVGRPSACWTRLGEQGRLWHR